MLRKYLPILPTLIMIAMLAITTRANAAPALSITVQLVPVPQASQPAVRYAPPPPGTFPEQRAAWKRRMRDEDEPAHHRAEPPPPGTFPEQRAAWQERMEDEDEDEPAYRRAPRTEQYRQYRTPYTPCRWEYYGNRALYCR